VHGASRGRDGHGRRAAAGLERCRRPGGRTDGGADGGGVGTGLRREPAAHVGPVRQRRGEAGVERALAGASHRGCGTAPRGPPRGRRAADAVRRAIARGRRGRRCRRRWPPTGACAARSESVRRGCRTRSRRSGCPSCRPRRRGTPRPAAGRRPAAPRRDVGLEPGDPVAEGAVLTQGVEVPGGRGVERGLRAPHVAVGIADRIGGGGRPRGEERSQEGDHRGGRRRAREAAGRIEERRGATRPGSHKIGRASCRERV